MEPTRTELDEFWEVEVERRSRRNRSWAELGFGVSGGLGALALVAEAGSVGFSDPFLVLVTGAFAGIPCAYTALRGMNGIWKSRPIQAPNPSRSLSLKRKSVQPDARVLERVVLEVMEDHGEVTPARVALETSCTVEEAEEVLSRLAEKGHLDVRVEGGRLVYSF